MTNFRLLFQYENEFYYPQEIEMRGYLNAVVEINNSDYYEVVFYTFSHLPYIKNQGGYIFTEPGIIFITELKKELMINGIKELIENGFFEGLKKYPAKKYKNYKEADF